MSRKQWGHGFHTGHRKAKADSRAASEKLRDPDLKPFRLLNLLMNQHSNKDIVNELHSALLQSPYAERYSHATWLMMDTGEMEDHRPHDPEKALKALADFGSSFSS